MNMHNKAKINKIFCLLALALLCHGSFMIFSLIQLNSQSQIRRSTQVEESWTAEFNNVTNGSLHTPAVYIGGMSDPQSNPKLLMTKEYTNDTLFRSDLERTTGTRHDVLRWIFKKFPDATENTPNINVSRSNLVSLNRNISDTRPPECKIRYSNTSSSSVSVIIVFHNEALTVLLRTIHSVINRTPDSALLEIILVDDNSTFDYLQRGLPVYVSYLPKVRIVRNSRRQGLIRSRNIGAVGARGDVLVFLDAHMECNQGWLEPLLVELAKNPTGAVQPSVDIVDPGSIYYYKYPGPPFRGGFGWDLRYSWFKVPDYVMKEIKTPADPFPTPVLVGCAIAIKRKYFDFIGRFDDGLNIWGGEHLDLSFRIWMCGGRILTVPCSRIGHYFKSFSYSFGEKDRELVIRKNLMRVSEIWMDEYKFIFYAATRSLGVVPAFTPKEKRGMERRREQRMSLNCQSFKWYLDNIIPEMKPPPKEAVYFGEVTNSKTSACLTPLRDGYIGITYECFVHRIIPENYFSIDFEHKLKYNDKCVVMDKQYQLLILRPCSETIPLNVLYGSWFIDPGPLVGQLKMVTKTGDTFCVTHVTNVVNKHKDEQMAQAMRCYPNSGYQTWSFSYKFTAP